MSLENQTHTDHYQARYEGLQEKFFRLIQEEERRSVLATLLRAVTTLAAWLYDKGTNLRNFLFDKGVLKTNRLNCPVISVGNLAMGGTGKTPMVVWLARLFHGEGYRVAILSRGYGGIESSRVTVVSDGENILANLETSGDEPLMLSRQLSGIPVLCSTKRVKAGAFAIEKFNSNVLVLDDGFQHRHLARDLDVVMLDARDPFANNRVFPRGTLREKTTALGRAQVLVLSHFDGSEKARKNLETLSRNWPDKIIATATPRPIRIFPAAGDGEIPLSSLGDLRLAAFAGIARPDDFFHSVHNLGGSLVYAAALPDHYPLTHEFLASLVRQASRFEPELWLTTEKDWVRLPEVLPEEMGLWVLAVEIDLDREDYQLIGAVRRVLESVKVGSEDSEG